MAGKRKCIHHNWNSLYLEECKGLILYMAKAVVNISRHIILRENCNPLRWQGYHQQRLFDKQKRPVCLSYRVQVTLQWITRNTVPNNCMQTHSSWLHYHILEHGQISSTYSYLLPLKVPRYFTSRQPFGNVCHHGNAFKIISELSKQK